MRLFAKRGYEWAEDGLVGLWSPVNTGATGLTLLDGSGFGNHGTATNYSNAIQPWAGSQFGTVLDFNGASNPNANYILCGNQTGFQNLGRITLSAWVFVKVSGSYAAITFGSSAYEILYDATIITFGAPGTGWCTALLTQVTNQWVHIVATQNGTASGNGALYFNGQPLSLSNNATPVINTIGATTLLGIRRLSDQQRPLNGQIGEATAWNRPLTASEVFEGYRTGPGGMWQLSPARFRSYFGATTTFNSSRFRTANLIGSGVY